MRAPAETVNKESVGALAETVNKEPESIDAPYFWQRNLGPWPKTAKGKLVLALNFDIAEKEPQLGEGEEACSCLGFRWRERGCGATCSNTGCTLGASVQFSPGHKSCRC